MQVKMMCSDTKRKHAAPVYKTSKLKETKRSRAKSLEKVEESSIWPNLEHAPYSVHLDNLQ